LTVGCGGGATERPFADTGEPAAMGEKGGSSAASPPQGAAASCLVVSDEPKHLMEFEHSAFVEPEGSIFLQEPTSSIGMLGVMDGSEARLSLRFKRCLDLSRSQHLTFEMRGISGVLEVALDVPTNLTPPDGSCVGARCYAPRAYLYLESGASSGQVRWADFQNGSPGALADPYHVKGLTWIKHGDPGDVVDLTISALEATTLD
jgi:hypothetical protein